MSDIKRLTPPQSRKVNALVRRTCCNYDSGNCILLDDGDECVCPQLISYSLLCKWFRIAVLPADKELYAELYHTEDMRRFPTVSLMLCIAMTLFTIILRRKESYQKLIEC